MSSAGVGAARGSPRTASATACCSPASSRTTSLAALYAGALAVVIPSLAEGFGLPAVEAAACGAPLVLSDLPAHRETLGSAALFFEPRDASELAAARASSSRTPRALGRACRGAARDDLGRGRRAAAGIDLTERRRRA